MSEYDKDVEHHSRRMLSFAMYRKLKSIVDGWDREERGKAKVVAAAVYALLAWLLALVVGAAFFPAYSGLLLPVGFLAWVVFVVSRIWKHLGP
jgi:hypothetical protein